MALYIAVYSVNIDVCSVYVTNNAIQAKNTNNKPITLHQAKTPDNRTLLLEHVTPGNEYIVIIDTFGTFDRDDDLILLTLKK